MYLLFYPSDKKFIIKKSNERELKENIKYIEFTTIESADKFAGDFGSPAGDDIKKVIIDGFYFEYTNHNIKRNT